MSMLRLHLMHSIISRLKSKQMLATYMPCMCTYIDHMGKTNLSIRIVCLVFAFLLDSEWPFCRL